MLFKKNSSFENTEFEFDNVFEDLDEWSVY